MASIIDVVALPDHTLKETLTQEQSFVSSTSVPSFNKLDQHGGLPVGFPQLIVSPSTWSGADFKNGAGLVITLNELEIQEIEEACDKFKELNLPLGSISEQNFHLPTLGERIRVAAANITNGVGFFRIQGLDPKHYSSDTNVILYLGISSYVGGKRGRQDELGNMLLHLTDLGSALAPEDQRQAPYSNVGQPFHTDTGDIIALYALGEALCGGESNLASIATVYNEIAKTRPDVLRLLAEPSWIFDRFGLSPPYTVRSILYPMGDDNVTLSFSRRPLVGHAWSPRSDGIPPLSSAQVEALNIIQAVAEQHSLSMQLKRGEMMFWNNLSLLHSRQGFTDSSSSRRHLLRLWLHNDSTENAWSVPQDLQAPWKDAFDHAGRQQLWPVNPIKDRDYVTNQQRSSGHD